LSFRFVRQTETGQGHTGEADAEFLQRLTPCDRLSHSSRHFIESVLHDFPSVSVVVCC
jgi:hypothetical protein